MAIVRVYTGNDGQSHFEDIVPEFIQADNSDDDRWPQAGRQLIHEASGTLARRFDSNRSNPWHHAPGRAVVFTLQGGGEIEVGAGTKRTIGPGDILIAEDMTGQGHYTREGGDKDRISIIVPMKEQT